MYYLLTKFGLPSLRDAYLYSIVDAVARYSSSCRRIEMFAIMCGVQQPEVYTSRISDVMLHVLKLLFPKFQAGVFRTRKYVPVLTFSARAIADGVLVRRRTGKAKCSWKSVKCSPPLARCSSKKICPSPTTASH